VVVARRKRKNGGISGSVGRGIGKSLGWTGRLLGVALCAFYALGYFSGLRAQNKGFAHRTFQAYDQYRLRLREEATLFRRLPIWNPDPPREAFEDAAAGNAVAVVERPDGFYMLSESGELRGPVRAGADDSLPIISGAPLDHVSPGDLVEYARALVRAEAELALVSEMRLDGDGEASLFLDRSRTQVVLDLGQMPLELDRAATVLKRWHGHESAIASLDMTTPGQAVMRLRAAAFAERDRSAALNGIMSGKIRRAKARPATFLVVADADHPASRRQRGGNLGGSVIEARLP
jgi:hypothetical protein